MKIKAQIKKGDILWYVNPSSGDVVYATEGEDNFNFYSIAGIRDGQLAHPDMLNHYDMWLTDSFSGLEVKGFVNLRQASEESFESKSKELDKKYNDWSKVVVAGTLDADGKRLVFANRIKDAQDVKNIVLFFSKNGLIKSGTMLQYNELEHPAIDLFKPKEELNTMNSASPITTAQADVPKASQDQYEELVLRFLSGDPDAGEALLKDKDVNGMIRGIINSWYKRYGKAVPRNVEDDSAYMDLYQEAVTYLLDRLNDYNPDKSSVKTFIYQTVEGAVRNYLNPARHKSLNNEVNVDNNGSNSDDKDQTLSFSNMEDTEDTRDKGNAENSEIVGNALENLDPKLVQVIKGLFYEDKTLEQIGTEMNVSKEYIRQLKEKALNLLRIHPEILKMSDGDSRNYVNAELVKMELIFDEPSELVTTSPNDNGSAK